MSKLLNIWNRAKLKLYQRLSKLILNFNNSCIRYYKFVKMAETRFTHPTKSSNPMFTIPRSKKKKADAPIPGPSDYNTS